jgi:hypothetical protein
MEYGRLHTRRRANFRDLTPDLDHRPGIPCGMRGAIALRREAPG